MGCGWQKVLWRHLRRQKWPPRIRAAMMPTRRTVGRGSLQLKTATLLRWTEGMSVVPEKQMKRVMEEQQREAVLQREAEQRRWLEEERGPEGLKEMPGQVAQWSGTARALATCRNSSWKQKKQCWQWILGLLCWCVRACRFTLALLRRHATNGGELWKLICAFTINNEREGGDMDHRTPLPEQWRTVCLRACCL